MRALTVACSLLLLATTAVALGGCNIPDVSDFVEPEPEPAPPELPPPPPPAGFVVTEVEPARGLPRGLELVEIRGGGFRDDSRVFFGGSEAVTVTVTSETRIFATTPPRPPGRVAVRVVNVDESSAVLERGYLYSSPVRVDAIVPTEGPARGGVPVEVRGAGFSGLDVLLFGGREALDVTVLDDETALCILPANPVGAADVHVVSAAGTAVAADGFLYYAPPEVSGFSPLAASTAGGGTLAITGEGLLLETVVRVAGTEARVLAASGDGRRLVVSLPPGPAGPAELSVATRHGGLTLPEAFTYLDSDAAGLLNVWPPSGPASGGGEATLVVAGLADEATSVWFGDEPAEVLSVKPARNAVLVRVPASAQEVPGVVVDVTVKNGALESTRSSAYAYEEQLRITSVSPQEGPADGGTEVLVEGEGFHDGVEVWVGALPVTSLEVLSSTRLLATTAVGSPGLADVRVRDDEREARAPNAFEYRAGETRLYVIGPDHGAIAGNTWVTIYGTDLPLHPAVRFGSAGAPWVERVSPTEIVLRSPRADEIATVDIQMTGGPGVEHWLPQAYTYFDPRARWGGTFGEPIDGSVNVTVLTSGDSSPMEGAMVVLGHDDPPQYKGYTDDRGQVTLSGPWLKGPVDVTAAQFGSSASTVVAFDAENVTLFLQSPAPPGGGGGTPLAPGRIVGRVQGLGKYLVTPPWPCDQLDPRDDGFCGECRTDADCGALAPQCTNPGNQPPFCSIGCALDADCPEGFACTPNAFEGPRCAPDPGTLQARCFTSSPSFLSPQPTATADNTIDLLSDLHVFELLNVRLGEVAVYCMAGGARTFGLGTPDEREVFRPSVMGIRRHVLVQPGIDPISGFENDPTELDIVLDIPLSRTVDVVIGDQPLRPDGPHRTRVMAHLELGSDGFVPLARVPLEPDVRELAIEGLPAALANELYDAGYLFHAAAVADTPDALPSSEVLRTGLGALDEGTYLVMDGAAWTTPRSGYRGDVTDLWAEHETSIFATTREGVVIHWNGDGWSAQPTPPGRALNSVSSDGAGGAWVVGDRGRVLRWDQVGWTEHDPGHRADLRDVHAFGPDAAVAVGAYVVSEWNGTEWVSNPFGPPKDLNAVWAPGAGDAWAVGADGIVLRRAAQTGTWSAVPVDALDDLHDVWGSSDGLLVAVGHRGRVLAGSADALEVTQTPTHRTLRGVWGRGADDLWAVGDLSTVLHFDGDAWTVVTTGLAEVSLHGIVGLGSGGLPLVAMGAHAVHLDPFMEVPTFLSPAPDQLWNQTLIARTARAGGAVPSFDNLRIFGPTGGLAWSIMAPSEVDPIHLPDLGRIEGLPLPPNGQKRGILYRVEHPGFDINDFDNRIFTLRDWRSWVLSTWTFDAPTDTAPIDTVPGQ